MKARSLSPLGDSIPRMQLTDFQQWEVRRVEAWGIEGYQVPRKYVNTGETIVFRPRSDSNSKKKKNGQGGKDSPGTIMPTKRFYLETQLKIAQRTPSSAQYNRPKKWALNAEEMEKIGKKLNPLSYHVDRRTFVDDIYRNEKRNGSSRRRYKSPTNEYAIQQAELKQERDELFAIEEAKRQKRNIFDEAEVLADATPGPGQYNPHSNIMKIKVDRRDCDYWKEKHATPSPVRDRLHPGVGTYTHFPAAYRTFGKLQVEQEKKDSERESLGINTKNRPLQKEGEKYLHSGFGVDRRYPNPKFSKSKIKYASSPGPGSHNLTEQWENKKPYLVSNSKASTVGQNPMKHITKGVQKSIYYD